MKTLEVLPVSFDHFQGTTYRLRATVRNIGTAPTPEGVVIGVSFWIGGSVRSWHDTSVGPLAPGQELTVEPTGGPGSPDDWSVFTSPPGMPSQVMAWVDDVDRIAEANEQNNQLSFIYTSVGGDTVGGVAGGYDLAIVRFLTDPEVPRAGEPFRVGAEVMNIGQVSTPAGVPHVVRYQVAGQEVRAAKFEGPIGPGERRILFSNEGGTGGQIVVAPGTPSALIEGRIDPDHLLVDEVNKENNEFFRITPRSQYYSSNLIYFDAALPDLIVTDVRIVTSEQGEGLNTFQATIKNSGSGTAEGIIGVSWWVNSTQVAWFDLDSGPLGPGQERTLRPNAGPGGADDRFTTLPHAGSEIELMAWVDDVGRIAESNDTNNRLTVTVTGPQSDPVPPAELSITSQPVSQSVQAGGSATFQVEAIGSGSVSYQWKRNGHDIAGANGSALTVNNASPADAGVYTVVLTDSGGSRSSHQAILGIRTTEKIVGSGDSPEHFRNIIHPNGNVYDQVLLTGPAATITADPGKVTRISFIDLNDDIVQVEFSGSGSLTVVLDSASGPAVPQHYNQDLTYMRGHASLIVQGAGADTYVSAFAVGRGTAVNQELFRDGVNYDGYADLARLAIQSDSGEAAAILMGNVHFFDTTGITGIFAPNVAVSGTVRVYDITASDGAQSFLVFGSTGNGVAIAGGDLHQANDRPMLIEGVQQVIMSDGTDAHGGFLPARSVQAELLREGSDVTQQVVVNP